MIGLEVESVDDKARLLAPFTIARVISAEQHPNADRLRVCMVDTGDGDPVQVVCGAPNARAGMMGVFVPPGAYIPGKDITLSVGKIRGVESRGMLVSEMEMQLSDDHEGIIELPADAPLGETYATWAGLDDPVIEIKLTPNRPDCTGVHGIARDLAAADMGKFIDKPVKPVKGAGPCPVKVTLDFGATPSLCRGFALRLVRGVKNGPSPDWLQKRLTAIGLRPINALVDITNFITYDRGRPLHVFDAAKVHGNLDGAAREPGETAARARRQDLHARRDHVRDRRRERRRNCSPASWAARPRGCDETTTDVLIESALWEPLNIAQTGRKLGINSDARYRFERGVDPAFMVPGLELATQMVLDLCGGTPSEITVAGEPQVPELIIDFPLAELKRLAGLDVPFPEMRARARPSRLLRRRPGQDREGRGAVVAAGRRTARPTSSRRSCASSASTACRRRRSTAARRRASRCSRRPGAHPQGQARARRARHGRGGDLVVHLEAAGRAVRRRQARSLRSPIRSRPTSPTCGRACCRA